MVLHRTVGVHALVVVQVAELVKRHVPQRHPVELARVGVSGWQANLSVVQRVVTPKPDDEKRVLGKERHDIPFEVGGRTIPVTANLALDLQAKETTDNQAPCPR